jgi:S-adenosylmethionine hydrolase
VTSSGIVTLTTDFGLADSYVAELYGVILTTFPAAQIVDISHDVPAGRIETALFLTESAWPHFPRETVHLVVVDPGVGTDRSMVALRGPRASYVGPDNGVLSSAFPASLRSAPDTAPVQVPDGYNAIEITETRVRATPTSRTFQGRDIMAPVAAQIALGTPLASLGEPLHQMRAAPGLAASEDTGRIIHIDHFGNAITNFRARTATADVRFVATTGWRDEVIIAAPTPTYATSAPDQPAMIAGSSGYLEIAWPNGDAAERLGLRLGDSVRLLRT